MPSGLTQALEGAHHSSAVIARLWQEKERRRGEDVKEYYFYLDSTPTHSYMKYLYKYPQPRRYNYSPGYGSAIRGHQGRAGQNPC